MLRLMLMSVIGVVGSLVPIASRADNAPVPPSEPVLEVHIDADYSIASHAAEAIESGLASALSEAGYEVAGTTLKLVRRDHRANVKRSRTHMEDFLNSTNAIAMVGGMHSPPYLTHRDFINENDVLFLLPWSAGGPITRGESGGENWLFRLSVDDTKAGGYLISRAVDQAGCQAVSLILIDTGWGRANYKTLTAALDQRGMIPASTHYFDVTIGQATAKRLAEDVRRSGADCAVLLADWDNGAQVVNVLADLDQPIRTFSHWGIMGGPFAQHVTPDTRDRLDLEVLQTCGLAREKGGNAALQLALSHAKGAPAELADVPAAAGFVHGYDLGRIFVAAVAQAAETPAWDGGIGQKRDAVRLSLESLEAEVEGILGSYEKPFDAYDVSSPDAHEALGRSDLSMARFAPEGHLIHAQ